MNEDQPNSHILSLTAQIVSAHVSNNSIQAEALPALILSVYKTLTGTGVEPVQQEKRQPAVPVKRSVFPDYIICLEDGKKLKMLKRHLRSTYGMTPADYRTKWNLPRDYPMVAPNYAATRSQLAKKIGLGRSPALAVISAPVEPPAASKKVPARRGRPTKTVVADAPAPIVELSPETAAPPAVKPTARRGRPAKAAAA